MVAHLTSANQCAILSRPSSPVGLISRQKGCSLARGGPPHRCTFRGCLWPYDDQICLNDLIAPSSYLNGCCLQPVIGYVFVNWRIWASVKACKQASMIATRLSSKARSKSDKGRFRLYMALFVYLLS